MKSLSLSHFIFLLVIGKFNPLSLFASELDDVTLVNPIPYKKNSQVSEYIISTNATKAASLINYDIVGEVKKKIAPFKNDLSGYFDSPLKLDQFIDQILIEGKNSILGNSFTDEKLILFYDYLGNHLIGSIADKILEKEGVNDLKRRVLWKNKLLTSFKDCIKKSSNALYDANHCLDVLSSGLVFNIGIGIVYELTSENLNAGLTDTQAKALNIQQTNFYKICMINRPPAASSVKFCAVESMKDGVLKTTEEKLSKRISQTTTHFTEFKKIKNEVYPPFENCIKKVGIINPKLEINECLDQLIQATGKEFTSIRISNNYAVKSNFKKEEIKQIAASKALVFEECIANQKKENARKDNLLDTDKCEILITNQLTYEIVLKTLSKAANDSLKEDPLMSSSVALKGKNILDRCWDFQMGEEAKEACLRKTILSFSDHLANILLNKAIPKELKAKEEITKKYLLELATCLNKNLPLNISNGQDLTPKIDACSNQLKIKVAEDVAGQLLLARALEQNLNQTDRDHLIKDLVTSKLVNCLGKKPNDKLVAKCIGELRSEASIKMAKIIIKTKAADKLSMIEIDHLTATLVDQNFTACLGIRPSEEKLDDCIGRLTQEATSAIVLSAQKKLIKEQLNTDEIPLSLKKIEETFKTCVEKKHPPKNTSLEIDECVKNYALAFALNLGDLKVNFTFKSILGKIEYHQNKKQIEALLLKYNSCLDQLSKLKMEDALLKKINSCVGQLEKESMNFVSETLNKYMTTAEKNTALVELKNTFAQILPCLSGLMPMTPYSLSIEHSVSSSLQLTAKIISDYIECSPQKAKQTLYEITSKFAHNLKDETANLKAKEELLQTLYQNGALDDFLKCMIQVKIKEGFEEIPESTLSKSFKDSLLSSENFDRIFNSKSGQGLKDLVMNKMLNPILLEQASFKSPSIVEGMNLIKDQVVKMLVFSPLFGEQLVKSGIQQKMDQVTGITRFFAQIIYGRHSLEWEKIRNTPEGMAAEQFIRDNILLPKIEGNKVTGHTEQVNQQKAENLITQAMDAINQ